jgi:hypothetical protein
MRSHCVTGVVSNSWAQAFLLPQPPGAGAIDVPTWPLSSTWGLRSSGIPFSTLDGKNPDPQATLLPLWLLTPHLRQEIEGFFSGGAEQPQTKGPQGSNARELPPSTVATSRPVSLERQDPPPEPLVDSK